MNYKFQKWFFDLNLDENTYIYFILVEIKFLFFKIRNFTFHYFHYPTGSITKSKSVQVNFEKGGWESLNGKGKLLNIIPEIDRLQIVSNFDDINISLTINNYQKEYLRESLTIEQNNKKIK